MKNLVFIIFLVLPAYAVRTSKELIIYRITEQSSPSDRRPRSRSYPCPEHIFQPAPLQIMPPVPNNTPNDLSLDELSVPIPEEVNQINPIKEEPVKDNTKCCTPGKLVVVGSICTAIGGVMTAIVTAAVTLIVHFTTK